MTTVMEVRQCKICRRDVPGERVEEGLKTCSSGCQRRYRAWKNPYERRIAQLMRACGRDRLIWNDKELQERLGCDRAEASARLLALARAKGLEVAFDHRGLVRCIGRVPPERRKYLIQGEVRP